MSAINNVPVKYDVLSGRLDLIACSRADGNVCFVAEGIYTVEIKLSQLSS